MLNSHGSMLKNRVILFWLGAIVPLEFRFTNQATGFVSISIGEILVYGLFFYWLLKTKENQSHGISSRALLPVILYCLWAIFSLAISPDIIGFQVVRDVITVSVFYSLLVSYITSYAGINRVLSGYCFGVILNLAICLPQIVFDWPRPISLDVSGANLKEALDGGANFSNVATGLFAHPNGLAPHICIAIFLFIGFATSSSTVKSRLIACLAIAVSLLVLYFTFAKGALLWLSLGLATFFLRKFIPQRMRFTYTISTVTFVIFTIAFVVIPYLVEEGLGGTVQTRITLWGVLGDILGDDYWGAIVGGNQKAMLNISGFYSSFEYPDAHNTYLNQVVYFGFIGFALFSWFLIKSLKNIIFINSSMYSKANVLWVIMSFLLGYIFFEPMHQGLSVLGLIYMFCGLAAAGANISEIE
jgi:hypothetical protein